MAFGLGAPGQSPETHAGEVRFKTLEQYRELMRQWKAAGPAPRDHCQSRISGMSSPWLRM